MHVFVYVCGGVKCMWLTAQAWPGHSLKGKVTAELEGKEWGDLPVARIIEKNNTFGDTPGIPSLSFFFLKKSKHIFSHIEKN